MFFLFGYRFMTKYQLALALLVHYKREVERMVTLVTSRTHAVKCIESHIIYHMMLYYCKYCKYAYMIFSNFES